MNVHCKMSTKMVPGLGFEFSLVGRMRLGVSVLALIHAE